ncbi:MAG: hypothetical protein Kow009_09800 [Spirochaetales bacterium]
MKYRLGGVFSILILLWFIGCSQEAFFGESVTPEPEAKVLSIADGTVLAPSAEIPLTLSVSSDLKKKGIEEPYTLSASILAFDGTEVASVTLDKVDPRNGPLPSLVPPGLGPGTYTLVLTLQRGQAISYQNRVTFFVEDGSYELDRISLFPPAVLPFSTAILKVELAVPAESDPWIRWSIEGSVVQEKLYSQGGGTLQWTAPGKEGVYPVQVELFPRAPEEGTTYSFASPITLSSQLVVSSSVGLQDSDFQPESEYWSLFHFTGNRKDSGYRKGKAVYGKGNLKEIGLPQVMLKGTMFGYDLDGKSGFMTDQLLLPLQETSFPPNWAVRFRLLPEEPVADRTWFETTSKDGMFRLQVRTNSDRRLEAIVETGGARVMVPSLGAIQAETPQEVELSFTQVGNAFQARWRIGDLEESPLDVFAVPAGGFTFTGNEGGAWIGTGKEGNGFVGVVDEFGIKVKQPSPAAETEGEAEGERPAGFGQTVQIRTEGKAEPKGSVYSLLPGGSLFIGPVELSLLPQEISFTIEEGNTGRGNPASMEIRLLGTDREVPRAVLSRKEGRWTMRVGETVWDLSPPEDGTIRFRVAKQGSTTSVGWKDTTIPIAGEGSGSDELTIQITCPSDGVYPLNVMGIRIGEQD